jgi:hypothetical protein
MVLTTERHTVQLVGFLACRLSLVCAQAEDHEGDREKKWKCRISLFLISAFLSF